jgi:hypothetical protein
MSRVESGTWDESPPEEIHRREEEEKREGER